MLKPHRLSEKLWEFDMAGVGADIITMLEGASLSFLFLRRGGGSGGVGGYLESHERERDVSGSSLLHRINNICVGYAFLLLSLMIFTITVVGLHYEQRIKTCNS